MIRPTSFLAVWAVGGALLTAQVWLWGWLQGIEKSWWECLVVSLPDLAIWAAVIPLAVALAARVPLRDGQPRAVAFHLPTAVVVALAATLAHVALALALGWVEGGAATMELLGIRVPLHAPTWMALYGAVVLGAELLRADPGDRVPADDESARSNGAAPLTRLALPAEEGARMIAVSEIHWLEADRNYVVVHTDGGAERLRGTLAELLERLPEDFQRIHRSRVVNLERVESIHRWRHGDHVVILRDGTRLRLSRTYRAAVEERLGTRL